MLVAGLPLLIVELAAGRAFQRGVYGAFTGIHRSARWAALFVGAVITVLVSYYLVITGWALGYFLISLGGPLPGFNGFVSGFNSLYFFLLAAGVSISIVLLGVRNGIEAISTRAVPVLVVAMVLLATYAVSLPGWGQALEFYLAPRPETLTNPSIWLLALGQVFFSVSLGMGVMITFGSYLPAKLPIIRSSVIVVTADVFIALLGGMVIFPFVFSTGGEPTAGPGLTFDVLPGVFALVPMGGMVGPIFYLILTLAAITSAISILEVGVAILEDAAGFSRLRSLAGISPIVLILGTVAALSYSPAAWRLFNEPVLDVLDLLVGSYALPTGVLVTAIVLGWLSPRALLIREISQERPELGRLALWLVRFVVPAIIILAFIVGNLA